MNEGKHNDKYPSYIHPEIIAVNKLKAKLLEAQGIIGDLLLASHGVCETGDLCVEISLDSLDSARNYLKSCGISYHYEAEGWDIAHQELLFELHHEGVCGGQQYRKYSNYDDCQYCLEDAVAQAEQEQDAQDSKKEAL
jgi:hypothetical protein